MAVALDRTEKVGTWPGRQPPRRARLHGRREVEVTHWHADGCGVEGEWALPLDGRYVLSFEGEGHRLELPVRTVWCRLERTEVREDGEVGPVFRAALTFDDDW